MSVTFVLNLFLLQTGGGMLTLCLFLPKDKVDRHFFKSISFFALLFMISGLVLRSLYPFQAPESFGPPREPLFYPAINVGYGIIAALALGSWGITLWSETAPFRLWLGAASLLSPLVIGGDALLFVPHQPDISLPVLLVPLHFVTASLVLGGYLLGMIFGHWYLIYTDMPKRLLVRMSLLLGGALALKCLAVALTWLMIRHRTDHGITTWELLTSWQGYGLFFWQRIAIGLLIPAIVTYLIWSTSRIGSNQSATGIMYTAVAFIFIGELIAKFLFLFSTIPL